MSHAIVLRLLSIPLLLVLLLNVGLIAFVPLSSDKNSTSVQTAEHSASQSNATDVANNNSSEQDGSPQTSEDGSPGSESIEPNDTTMAVSNPGSDSQGSQVQSSEGSSPRGEQSTQTGQQLTQTGRTDVGNEQFDTNGGTISEGELLENPVVQLAFRSLGTRIASLGKKSSSQGASLARVVKSLIPDESGPQQANHVADDANVADDTESAGGSTGAAIADTSTGSPEETTSLVTQPREPFQATIRNPLKNGYPVSFLVDGKSHSLDAGQSLTVISQQPITVHFDRGGNLGQHRVELSDGTYRWSVSATKGWSLD